MMTSLAMSLASVVDSMIVGNLLGADALAAVGLASPMIFIVNLIYMLFGIGGLTCASIARGGRETEKANQVFTFAMVGGVLTMLSYVALVLIFLDPISLHLASGDPVYASLIAEYMKYLIWAGPTLMFSSGLALFLRIDGKPKAAANVIFLANGINLFFDYYLISQTSMGIGGAGLSTTLGYLLAGVTLLPYLCSSKRSFRFQWKKLLPSTLLELLTLGTPKALNQCASCVRLILLNTIIFHVLGPSGLSIMVVCINLLLFSGVFINGTSDALLPIIGGFYGEKDYYGIRQGVKFALRIMLCSTCVFMFLLLLAPLFVSNLFGLNDVENQDIIALSLRLFAIYIPIYGVNILLQNIYTVTKREKLARRLALFDGLFFVVFYAALYGKLMPDYLWLCFVSSGISTFLTLIFWAKAIEKKENLKGILLLKEDHRGETWDLSIPAKEESVMELSKVAINFCVAQGVEKNISSRLGNVIEELGVSIIQENQKDQMIDVLIRVVDEEIMVRFRDNGVFFDPSTNEGKLTPFSSLETLHKLTSKVEYIQQLGFNSTILTIDR